MTNLRLLDSLPGGPGGSAWCSPLDGLSEHDRQLIDAVAAVQAHCDPRLAVKPCRQAAAERAARLEEARRERAAPPAEEREIERLLGGRTP